MPAGVSAWTPLATIRLASTTTSVTFSAINQGFRDLVVVSDSFSSGGAGQIYFRFNGDVAANYHYAYMLGDGTTTSRSIWTGQSLIYTQTYTSDQQTTSIASCILNIMDYSATDKHKTIIARNNAALGPIATIGRWVSSAAITSLTVGIGSNSFAAGSTFMLYGVSA